MHFDRLSDLSDAEDRHIRVTQYWNESESTSEYPNCQSNHSVMHNQLWLIVVVRWHQLRSNEQFEVWQTNKVDDHSLKNNGPNLFFKGTSHFKIREMYFRRNFVCKYSDRCANSLKWEIFEICFSVESEEISRSWMFRICFCN